MNNGGRFLLRGVFLSLLICPLFADSIAVSATAAFTGFNNTWNFSYTTGATGVFLEQITIDLSPTDVRFDTAPGGFGSLGYQDVGNFQGTDATTGLTAISAVRAPLDGGSLLTFTFDNFTVGDDFTFSADVDHPNPTLQTLANCTSLGPVLKALCNVSNGLKTTANNAALFAADTVLSAQLANANITFEFGGPGYDDASVTEPLDAATLQSIIQGLIDGNGGNSFASQTGADEQINAPEPATLAMGVAGLGLLFLSRRRR